MNHETMLLLEQQFDTAFAAPDGIQKLRELILTLAMQGKLLPQDPNDQPASELLKEITEKKQSLVKEKKVGKSDPSMESSLEEIPYILPKEWEWAILEQLVLKIGSGSTPRGGKDSYVPDGIPFLRSQNIWNHGLRLDDVVFISKETHAKMAATTVMPRDILLNITGASLGRCALVSDDFKEANVSQHVTIIRCVFPETRRFIHCFFLSPYGQSMIWTRQVGMSREGLSKKVLERFYIPFPPLVEQRRIVAKIDQLMARCDELEKLRSDRAQKLITVHTEAIAHLLTAQDSRDFSTAWHFITQHFSELYSVKETVAELRKTILQLAVMGKLVPQDSNDEPASIQFKYIRQQVDELVRKKIEREIKFKYINAEDENFSLPKNWLWVKLGSLLRSLKYGTSKKCEYNSPGTAVLRIPNIDVDLGCINVEKLKYTNLLTSELEDLYLIPNDLLIIRSNGSLSLVGRTAVISEAEEGLAYAGYLVRLRSFPEYVYSRYLYFVLNTVSVRDQIEQPIRSTSGVKNINSTEIANIAIPLPPLAEQHRIVAKVDQLMALCDLLEGAIAAAQTKQTNLLNAVMAQV
jgi:type I restriction enzyme, S subunit